LATAAADWAIVAAAAGEAAAAAATSWGSFPITKVFYYNGGWGSIDGTKNTSPGSGKDVLIAGYYFKPDSNGDYTLNSAYTDYKFAKLP
jgi:hypothetical protein